MLLDPVVVEEVIREFQAHSVQQRSSTRAARAKQAAELAEVKRRAARLVDQVADGVLSGAAVQEKLAALELSRATLERELAAASADDNVVSHSALPQRFRRLVDRMNSALAEVDTPERLAARGAFRDMIRQVAVTPGAGRGTFEVAVEMETAAPVSLGGRFGSLGAGTRSHRDDTNFPRLILKA
jgi:hypothetical protein